MCTRYYMELGPELRPIIEAAQCSSLTYKMMTSLARLLKMEGEIRPTDMAPVIALSSKGIQSVFPMIWGFTSSHVENTKRSAPLVNCRVETASEKPLWAESWSRRRCIIPASYYFEWEHLSRPDGSKKAGDKYIIQPANSSVCFLAGLYRLEDGLPHFTVLTRTPSDEIKFIHDWMPVILPEAQIKNWINPLTTVDVVKEIAAGSLTDIVFEKA